MPLLALSTHLFEPLRCHLRSLGLAMKRREFITLVGGAAAAWPLAARAQKRVPRIAILEPLKEGDREGERWLQAFLQKMQMLGWKRGSNVEIDLRWGDNLDLFTALAKELVALRPDL